MSPTRSDRGTRPLTVRADLADLTPYGAPQLNVPVRLNTNETPYPPPEAFHERLMARLPLLELNRYPDRTAHELRTALGQRFGLGPAQVWAANGSNEVFLQLFQAYGGPGRRLLLTNPGYSAHPLIARVSGTETRTVELNEAFALEPEAAADAVRDHNPDLICVGHPNNPTGALVGQAAVRALHDSSQALVIVDEAYVEFARDGSSMVSLLDELPRLVVCRTFSKAWRLAGLRLGYLLGPDWVVDDLRKVRLPYHLDSLTQAAGLTALELADQVTAHIAAVVADRGRLFAALSELPAVRVYPSEANFLLLRAGVDDLFGRLLERGVLVRDFARVPRLAGCIRVTVGSSQDNERFLDALRALTAGFSDTRP